MRPAGANMAQACVRPLSSVTGPPVQAPAVKLSEFCTGSAGWPACAASGRSARVSPSPQARRIAGLLDDPRRAGAPALELRPVPGDPETRRGRGQRVAVRDGNARVGHVLELRD